MILLVTDPSVGWQARTPVGGAPGRPIAARAWNDGRMAAPKARPTGQVGRPGYDLDSLLAVAVAVFNQRGYDGTSMEHLASKLGISKSSIYHHVPGKAELLRLSVDRALDALFAVTDEPETTTGPAIDRLEHMVRRSVAVLVEQLPYVTLLLRIRGNTTVERRALARRRELDHFVGQLGSAGGQRRQCPAGRRPGADVPAHLRHRELPDRVVPPEQKSHAGRARRCGGEGDL